MFKKMATIINIPRAMNNAADQIEGPPATLKDQIYSGEILKNMYHRKEN